MIAALDRLLAYLATLEAKPETTPLDQLKAVARWTMQVQLAGEMLPAQNSALRSALMTEKAQLDRLMEVSHKLGAWIMAARKERSLNPKLPPEVILYTLFARACDPVLAPLKVSGNHGDEQIIEMLLSSRFDGLVDANGRPGARYLDRSQARH